jgi:hypothetical protein
MPVRARSPPYGSEKETIARLSLDQHTFIKVLFSQRRMLHLILRTYTRTPKADKILIFCITRTSRVDGCFVRAHTDLTEPMKSSSR